MDYLSQHHMIVVIFKHFSGSLVSNLSSFNHYLYNKITVISGKFKSFIYDVTEQGKIIKFI